MKLEINTISKSYNGNVHALKQFSLTLEAGVLGLLGPNGAGKSTLMRILSTVTTATEGSVTWNGIDIVRSPDSIRQILGYLPQDFGVYPHLNAIEFLTYLAAARGLTGSSVKMRINELLQLVNLTDAAKRPLGTLSGGMKQRVGIAQALLNDPKLLIVDEPTAGLDPGERIRFRNLLAELSGERIVILSSHIVSDIEATATEVAIINKGSLITHSRPEHLLTRINGKVWEMVIPSEKLAEAKEKYLISNSIRTSEGLRLKIVSDKSPGTDDTPADFSSRCGAAVGTLEDAYLYMLSTHNHTN
jgi:ABC-2 type transport system ATP-binding protein